MMSCPRLMLEITGKEDMEEAPRPKQSATAREKVDFALNLCTEFVVFRAATSSNYWAVTILIINQSLDHIFDTPDDENCHADSQSIFWGFTDEGTTIKCQLCAEQTMTQNH